MSTPESAKSTEVAERWGSDLIAEAVRELGIPYICLVPGASYRGLHDSFVNHLGNSSPSMIVCLHEEHAVSIAQGYAKVTDAPLAVLLHANVGLLHGSMAIFNAWCDRVPLLAIGATGPLDAERRRPWIDWIHTSIDQGAVVRGFVKWDDQPGSPLAAIESLRRGAMIASTRPCGPVYINIDSTVQEQQISPSVAPKPLEWFAPARSPAPSEHDLADALAMISAARRPVVLCGRASRQMDAWNARIEFAEAINAPVFVEYNSAASFPRSHPLFAEALRFSIKELPLQIRDADLIISLDWTDLGGTLSQIVGTKSERAKILACSNDQEIHRGWNMDYQKLAFADLRIATTPESFVAAINSKLMPRATGTTFKTSIAREKRQEHNPRLDLRSLAANFKELTEDRNITLVSNPLGWPAEAVRCEHPLDFLGANGGGGLGAGPGIAIGAALALRDHHKDRTAVAVLGDGDYLMGVNALWTAAKFNIGLLIVVANNRSYFNDETHQEHVARVRHRPVENKWIGQRLDDPAPDLAALARAQGVGAAGPITELAHLRSALAEGLDAARSGRPFVVDVVVPAEYAA